MPSYVIRRAEWDDIAALQDAAEKCREHNEPHYFETCLNEQEEGKREILLAEKGGEIIAYGQLIWNPIYKPFRKFGIAEIQDLRTIPQERCQGIASVIIDMFETMVREKGGREIGIGFGLDSSFGAAQRLYIKKGYVPDGCGLCYDDENVDVGTMRSIDSLLTLKLIKNL